jgi:hypothetical protein
MPEQMTAATATRRRAERWFYVGAGVFLILLSVVAFGPSIIDPSRRTASLTPLVIAHGIVSGAWLLLFLMQAMLVATGRTAVHRRVGIIGFALAAVVVGYAGLTSFSSRGVDTTSVATSSEWSFLKVRHGRARGNSRPGHWRRF